MAKSKGSRSRKPTKQAAKSPGARTAGALRVRRETAAYARTETPGAATIRLDIDEAVKHGEDLRRQIEARIEQRFAEKARWPVNR